MSSCSTCSKATDLMNCRYLLISALCFFAAASFSSVPDWPEISSGKIYEFSQINPEPGQEEPIWQLSRDFDKDEASKRLTQIPGAIKHFKNLHDGEHLLMAYIPENRISGLAELNLATVSETQLTIMELLIKMARSALGLPRKETYSDSPHLMSISLVDGGKNPGGYYLYTLPGAIDLTRSHARRLDGEFLPLSLLNGAEPESYPRELQGLILVEIRKGKNEGKKKVEEENSDSSALPLSTDDLRAAARHQELLTGGGGGGGFDPFFKPGRGGGGGFTPGESSNDLSDEFFSGLQFSLANALRTRMDDREGRPSLVLERQRSLQGLRVQRLVNGQVIHEWIYSLEDMVLQLAEILAKDITVDDSETESGPEHDLTALYRAIGCSSEYSHSIQVQGGTAPLELRDFLFHLMARYYHNTATPPAIPGVLGCMLTAKQSQQKGSSDRQGSSSGSASGTYSYTSYSGGRQGGGGGTGGGQRPPNGPNGGAGPGRDHYKPLVTYVESDEEETETTGTVATIPHRIRAMYQAIQSGWGTRMMAEEKRWNDEGNSTKINWSIVSTFCPPG